MAIKSLRSDVAPHCILDLFNSDTNSPIQCFKLDTINLKNLVLCFSCSKIEANSIRYSIILESENENMSGQTTLPLTNIISQKAINSGRDFEAEDFQLLAGETNIVTEIGILNTKRYIQLYLQPSTTTATETTGTIVAIGKTFVLPAMKPNQVLPS